MRYSIERGFFGPGVRVALGLLLAAALVGAGEFLRRREDQPVAAAQVADIPAMLTATGTLAAFGTIYAAYALYHFIGIATAFVALGATALACLALATLHGQALAGLGLIGALATPFLTPSDDPSPWPVVIYLGVVAAAAHALAHAKQWLWVSLAAAAGAGGWAVLLFAGMAPRFFAGGMTHIVVQTALAAAFLAVLRRGAEPEADTRFDRPANAALAGAAILTVGALLFGTITDNTGWTWLAGAGTVVVILAATGVRVAAVASATAGAALVVLAVMTLWPPLILPYGFRGDIIAGLFRPDDPNTYRIVALAGCLSVAVISGARLLRARALPLVPSAFYAGAAALTPLGGLGIAYLRFSEARASWPLALTAAAAALAYTAGGRVFLITFAATPVAPIRLGLGALASAAIAAGALALVFALEGGTLTVALGLAAAGTAVIAVRLDLTALRWCVAALGILIGARLAWDPRSSAAPSQPRRSSTGSCSATAFQG